MSKSRKLNQRGATAAQKSPQQRRNSGEGILFHCEETDRHDSRACKHQQHQHAASEDPNLKIFLSMILYMSCWLPPTPPSFSDFFRTQMIVFGASNSDVGRLYNAPASFQYEQYGIGPVPFKRLYAAPDSDVRNLFCTISHHRLMALPVMRGLKEAPMMMIDSSKYYSYYTRNECKSYVSYERRKGRILSRLGSSQTTPVVFNLFCVAALSRHSCYAVTL